MKVTVETLGQFCAAQAEELHLIFRVLEEVGGRNSNAATAARLAAMESLGVVLYALREAAQDADRAQGFDVPEKPAALPPAKVVHVKRGRKPKEKAAAPVEAVKPTVEMFPPTSIALSMAADGARVLDDVEVSE